MCYASWLFAPNSSVYPRFHYFRLRQSKQPPLNYVTVRHSPYPSLRSAQYISPTPLSLFFGLRCFSVVASIPHLARMARPFSSLLVTLWLSRGLSPRGKFTIPHLQSVVQTCLSRQFFILVLKVLSKSNLTYKCIYNLTSYIYELKVHGINPMAKKKNNGNPTTWVISLTRDVLAFL